MFQAFPSWRRSRSEMSGYLFKTGSNFFYLPELKNLTQAVLHYIQIAVRALQTRFEHFN